MSLCSKNRTDGYNPEDPDNSRWPSLPVVSDPSIPIEQWLANIPYGEIYDFNPSVDASQRIDHLSPRLFHLILSGPEISQPLAPRIVVGPVGKPQFSPRRLTLADGISPPLNLIIFMTSMRMAADLSRGSVSRSIRWCPKIC